MLIGIVIGIALAFGAVAIICCARAAARADAIIKAGKAPGDATEHDVLNAENISIPDRHALLAQLKAIRDLPTADLDPVQFDA